MTIQQIIALVLGQRRVHLLESYGPPAGLLITGKGAIFIHVQAPDLGYPLELARHGSNYRFSTRAALVAFIALHEAAHLVVPACDEAAADALSAAILWDLAAIKVREPAGYNGP
jgi:hypothetical protein